MPYRPKDSISLSGRNGQRGGSFFFYINYRLLEENVNAIFLD